MSQRDDLTAGVAVVAFLAQLIFAQLTLALVICLVIVSKVTRWRALWLAVPATAGVAWLLAIGVRPATAGYLAVGSRLLRVLTRHDTMGARAQGLSGLLAGWRHWLPGQLPLALIAATAQAAIISLPGRMAARLPPRRGALVAARSRYLAATLRRGELATYDGCCLGIVPSTGRRAAISWHEAEAGVLCASQDAAAASATGADLALAAIQHRKAVVIVDLIGDAESVATRKRHRSRTDFIESECAAAGATLRYLGCGAESGGHSAMRGTPPSPRWAVRGTSPSHRWPVSLRRSAHYDPLSGAGPARATNLTMAMIDWTGVAHARQLFCVNYLNAAFTLLTSSTEDHAGPGRTSATMLDELVRLMTPGVLRARLDQVRGRQLAVGSLAARVAELSRQLEADPAALAPVAAQLAALSSAALAQLIRPAADGASISIAAGLVGREVALFSLDRLVLGEPATMIARLVVADLIEALGERSDLGSRADCLVWINGCEVIDHRQLAALVALGERTGSAVVLGTALGSVAARIAAGVNVVAVRGASPVGFTALAPGLGGLPATGHDEMADVLAAWHAPGCADALSFAVRRPRPRLVAGCEVPR